MIGVRSAPRTGATGRASRTAALLVSLALPAGLAATGCHTDMYDQPKLRPLEASSFFSDGASARPQVEGTVARGQLRLDELLEHGTIGGEPARVFPFPITAERLERGRERFDIFCSPCHGRTGDGDGMIVRRGFKAPPSYHIERLREAAEGHFFDVITNGFGAMYDYRSRLDPATRWEVIAYIRALQLSRSVRIADLPAGERDAVVRALESASTGRGDAGDGPDGAGGGSGGPGGGPGGATHAPVPAEGHGKESR